MDDRIHILLLEYLFKPLRIADIRNDQLVFRPVDEVWQLAQVLLLIPVRERPIRSGTREHVANLDLIVVKVSKAVDTNDSVPKAEQPLAPVGADKTRSSGYAIRFH
ncbi:hypothetical protein D3C84_1007070 [compost metagenome]